jgi:hypoxanthine phosphoribosyltransferase
MQEKDEQNLQPYCPLERGIEKEIFRCELISFNKVLKLSKTLSLKIRKSGYTPDLIIAIGRGGYVPARLVSDFLLFSDLTSMKIEHYTRAAAMQPEARIRFPISIDITGKKVLVVDDITDTGDTLKLAVSYVWSLKPAEVKTAVLQHKPCSNFIPDFYAQTILKWRWIIYPWARYEDLAGFTEKILGDKTLDISQIITEFKRRYELNISESELLEILNYLTERKKIEYVEGKIPRWKIP